jgi:DinB superfamily/Pentapeptide repeats (8 copies)
MTTSTETDQQQGAQFVEANLQGARFFEANLQGARFVESDLSGVVMRGVEVSGADIDAPWLPHGEPLRVNGVDVIPLVEAELNRRFPGRADRRAPDPDGLRAAWARIESTWTATLERVAAMPAGTVDVSVAGEWSFAQTLRHLVLATDTWLRRAILEIDKPFHAIGEGYGAHADGVDPSTVTGSGPSYAEVLEVRDGRVAMVRDFLANVTAEELAAPHNSPHDPDFQETTLSCLHVILEEEWEHHRFAVRDLGAIEAEPDA